MADRHPNGGLLLRRHEGEKIVIDGSITVTVAEIRGGRVALVINAPRDVQVWRAELVDPATGLPPPREDSHVPG